MEPADWATAVVAFGLGILATIIGVVLSDHRARRLARETGSFDRADIEISLFGQPLGGPDDEPSSWYFLIPESGITAIFPFAMTIANRGSAATGDLVVTFTTPDGCLAPAESVTSKITPSVVAGSVARTVDAVGKKLQAAYRVPSIPPRAGVRIQEPIALRPTTGLTTHVPFTTNDKVDMVAEFAYSYALHFTVVIHPPNAPAIARSIKVFGVVGADVSMAVDEIAASFRKRLSGSSSRTFLRRLFTTYRKGSSYVVQCAPGVRHAVKDHSLIEMDGESLSVHVATYSVPARR